MFVPCALSQLVRPYIEGQPGTLGHTGCVCGDARIRERHKFSKLRSKKGEKIIIAALIRSTYHRCISNGDSTAKLLHHWSRRLVRQDA